MDKGMVMEVHFDEAVQHLAGTDRIRKQTDQAINARIDRDTDIRIMWYADRPAGEVNLRLGELDEEWDMERVLASNGSLLALTGAVLGCPAVKDLVPLLRRLGIRTRREIDRERQALRRLVNAREAVAV
ncbi:MAG: hypothetical protein H0W72_11675 [Planctomycetes bacterium]|nr:hypothetical protein [Planctomycetota bacterium]